MADDRLTKDDLVLLMESYKNVITMHQAVLDRSNKIIENMDSLTTKIDKISEKTNDHQARAIENTGKILNKIYLGWIGMASIILSLIALGTVVIDKIHNLHLPISP